MLPWGIGILIQLNHNFHQTNQKSVDCPRFDTTRNVSPGFGFTLIEVLVVIVIISIVTTVALLSLGDLGRSRHAEVLAEELAHFIPIVQQQAILQPAVLGISINDNSIDFYRFFINPKEHTGTWQPIKNDNLFRKQTISSDVAITILTEHNEISPMDNEKSKHPQIILLPSGDMSAFTITIGTNRTTALYQLIGQSNGILTLKKLMNK